MKPIRAAAGLFAGSIALGALALQAAELPRADPAEVGLSAERLAALDARVMAEIEAGAFPGAVILIARGGKVAHFSALGARTEGGEPMPEDAVFRIYSMTKPVTSVAAMMLVEEGRLDLSHPVHVYLPEYREMTVLSDDGESVPARRAMTVQDLLLHTAGLTYGFFGAGPARDALNEANVEYGGFDNREVARIIGGLPLEHHPGEVWEYSRSTDVLGAVIEVVEGRSLGEVFQERIFAPLGMTDTGFWADDEDERARLAEANADDMSIGAFDMFDPTQARAFESGGGGLVSTAADYARFAQMLLNGGELDGTRLLSPATVAYMTTDHLAAKGVRPGKYYLPGPGYGFGLGVGVRTAAGGASAPGGVGEHYWGGAGGTYYWIDPAQDMFVVYMMQSPAKRVPLRSLLRNMVYGAIEGPAAD